MASSRISNMHITRRDFIKVGAMAAPIPALLPRIVTSKSNARKPNLLVLWTDEQRADTMAAYGNRAIHAPNLNKLAGECVVFDKAYVSQPVCTPSRSTVMTGRWPHENGCTQNNIALDADVPTLPELMKDSDYRTGYYGKWHLGDEVYAQHGFEEWRSIEDIYWRYFGEDRNPGDRSSYHHWLQERGYTPEKDSNQFGRSFAARLPIEHCKPKFLEQETCDFLSRHRDDPFMLYVNFLEPHMPFFGSLDDEHAPGAVNLPLNWDDPLEANEPEVYKQKRQKYLERGWDGFDLNTEDGWRKLIARYWGLVTQVDLSVGAILAHLERLGLADDTIIVYTSDHGDMMGSHKMITKTVMYEESVRVPWLMRVPSLGRTQRHVARTVSHIDLVPTLLDLMKPGESFGLPGKSLCPVMKGESVAEEPVLIQWTEPDEFAGGQNPHGKNRQPLDPPGNDVRTIVAEGWKLCIHSQDKNQLFNLQHDPGETTNVYDVSENKPVVRRLAGQIRAWQERVGDKRMAIGDEA